MCVQGRQPAWVAGRGTPSSAAFLGIKAAMLAVLLPLGGMWGWGGLCALGTDGFASVYGSGTTSCV